MFLLSIKKEINVIVPLTNQRIFISVFVAKNHLCELRFNIIKIYLPNITMFKLLLGCVNLDKIVIQHDLTWCIKVKVNSLMKTDHKDFSIFSKLMKGYLQWIITTGHVRVYLYCLIHLVTFFELVISYNDVE